MWGEGGLSVCSGQCVFTVVKLSVDNQGPVMVDAVSYLDISIYDTGLAQQASG